jgi:hypothetical protein
MKQSQLEPDLVTQALGGGSAQIYGTAGLA